MTILLLGFSFFSPAGDVWMLCGWHVCCCGWKEKDGMPCPDNRCNNSVTLQLKYWLPKSIRLPPLPVAWSYHTFNFRLTLKDGFFHPLKEKDTSSPDFLLFGADTLTRQDNRPNQSALPLYMWAFPYTYFLIGYRKNKSGCKHELLNRYARKPL